MPHAFVCAWHDVFKQGFVDVAVAGENVKAILPLACVRELQPDQSDEVQDLTLDDRDENEDERHENSVLIDVFQKLLLSYFDGDDIN